MSQGQKRLKTYEHKLTLRKSSTQNTDGIDAALKVGGDYYFCLKAFVY